MGSIGVRKNEPISLPHSGEQSSKEKDLLLFPLKLCGEKKRKGKNEE